MITPKRLRRSAPCGRRCSEVTNKGSSAIAILIKDPQDLGVLVRGADEELLLLERERHVTVGVNGGVKLELGQGCHDALDQRGLQQRWGVTKGRQVGDGCGIGHPPNLPTPAPPWPTA